MAEIVVQFLKSELLGFAKGSRRKPAESPTLRDALREQLGLELRPVKNVPIDVVVVDSANKVPTEN